MLNINDYTGAVAVFRFFEEISQVPRASHNTSPIADYLVRFAEKRGLSVYRDESDNVIITKPATKGYEEKEAVILQGHTDMVADKTADSTVDMSKDGLKLYRDGDFIKAEGTTLGADDGIAMAYSLALLDSADIPHPKIEALFTSDEEVGLLGAAALDTSRLTGKTMINIDSDVEGIFTVGCAGGMRMDLVLPYERAERVSSAYRISLSGLLGGHSGTEIDKGRINGIKALFEIISSLSDSRLIEVSGGNADNAIPRYAECKVYSSFNEAELEAAVNSVKAKYIEKEPRLEISLEHIMGEFSAYDIDSTQKITDAILSTPTGVYKMSEELIGLPETSSNLGIIKTEVGKVAYAVSLRSSKNSEKNKLREVIRNIGARHKAVINEHGEYPAWEYRKVSPLSDVMSRVYKRMYKKSPEICVIHAGLECGIFSEKIPGLDCVSIGPDNYDIHTTSERLSISSTVRVWEYLKEVLKEI
jgi:dipeptidase D